MPLPMFISGGLFQFEGFTVSTFHFGWVHFMGANGDSFQRAVVFCTAMVSALLNGTSNSFVCIAIHKKSLLEF